MKNRLIRWKQNRGRFELWELWGRVELCIWDTADNMITSENVEGNVSTHTYTPKILQVCKKLDCDINGPSPKRKELRRKVIRKDQVWKWQDLLRSRRKQVLKLALKLIKETFICVPFVHWRLESFSGADHHLHHHPWMMVEKGWTRLIITEIDKNGTWRLGLVKSYM